MGPRKLELQTLDFPKLERDQDSDSDWYKNMPKTPTIRLAANGTQRTAQARLIKDAAQVHDIVEKFRAKYGTGEVKKYYTKFDVGIQVPLT
jgi:hypothetical protein